MQVDLATSKDWASHLRQLEKDGCQPEEILKVFEASLAVGFDRGSDHFELWLTYLSYLRRHTDWKNEKEVEKLRKTFQVANQHLSNFPDGDPNCAIPIFLATIEAKYLNNLEEARGLWEAVLDVEPFTSKAETWIEYAYFERTYGDETHFRRALMTSLDKPLDFPEAVGEILLKFEREEGQSVESFEEAYAKHRNAVNKAKKRFLKAKKKEQFEKDKKIDVKGEKGKQRKRKDAPMTPTATPTVTATANADSIPKGESDDSKLFKVPVSLDLSDEQPKSPKAKKTKLSADVVKDEKVIAEMERQNDYKAGRREINELNTIMISNLDYSLDEEKLREIFQQFGEILDLRLVRNYKGLSKGYAFIEYSTIQAVRKALKNDRMIIDSRPAFITEYGKRKGLVYSTGREDHKLFVSNLLTNVTASQLRELFKNYGTITDVRIVTKRDGSSKGVAYVEFDQPDSARAALELDGHLVDEQPMRVAISNPPIKYKKESQVLGAGTLKLTPNIGTAKQKISVPLVPRVILKKKNG